MGSIATVAAIGLTSSARADPPYTVCAADCPYTTVLAAITAAAPASTITSRPGTYTEDVIVNKAVSLVGAGAASTTIVATSANASPLTFAAPAAGATVSGFTLTHNYTGRPVKQTKHAYLMLVARKGRFQVVAVDTAGSRGRASAPVVVAL